MTSAAQKSRWGTAWPRTACNLSTRYWLKIVMSTTFLLTRKELPTHTKQY